MLDNDSINNVFDYIPLKQYKIDKSFHKNYTNYVNYYINIIKRFLKKIVKLKKLCKCQYLISNNRKFTKNTLIKFILIHYNYSRDCGLPDIMIGSYNLSTDLLDIMKDIYNRKAYDIYKFLKQDDITSEIIINCWYSFYIY